MLDPEKLPDWLKYIIIAIIVMYNLAQCHGQNTVIEFNEIPRQYEHTTTIQSQSHSLNNVYKEPDALSHALFVGDSITLEIFALEDSIVITDPSGNTTVLMSGNSIIAAKSPTSGYMYRCYVFGSVQENATIVEFSYNARKQLWAIAITLENSMLVDGGSLWRPFPPLREIKKEKAVIPRQRTYASSSRRK